MKNSTLWRSLFSIASAMLIFNAGNLFATTVALIGGQGTVGHVDGNTYTEALFNTPSGMTMDAYGDLWVADTGNNCIRTISAPESSQGGGSGTLTFAPVVANLIVKPIGVALDDMEDVIILDYGNGKNGNILTYDYYGDLVATNAMNLTNAAAMAMDLAGNIYVTVNGNQILKYTAPGVSNVVVTITNAGTSLQGLVVKQAGNHAGWLAVCDAGRNGVYLVNPVNGTVITNAGFHGAGDFPNGTDISSPQDAKFNQPMGVAETGDGSLIVTDYGNNRVKVIKASDGGVTNLYGVVSSDWVGPFPGFSSTRNPSKGGPEVVQNPDTPGGVSAREPNGIIFAPDGTVFVTEEYYNLIREATGSGLSLPPPPAPVTPTGLTATTNSAGVLLTWTASPGATNYTIYRATSGLPTYVVIGNTSSTSFTDTSPLVDETNYYEVTAQNTGGTSGFSTPAFIVLLPPPPPPPQIGWYDFEGNTLTGFFSVLHPVSGAVPYIAYNPLLLAINPTETGIGTAYITIPPATSGAVPTPTYGSTPPIYENNQLYGSSFVNPLPSLTVSNGLVTVEAINYETFDGNYVISPVTSASFLFQAATPTVVENNAAQFTVTDITTNVIIYYTLDGSDPSNAPPSQQVISTNGSINLSLNGSTNIFFQARAYGYGPDYYFAPSGIGSAIFSPGAFIPNNLSWGFASGECSSAFVGAAGQTFYAPVTLTMLPGVTLYSLQFNMTVSSTGAGVTNPAPAAGPFNFQTMILEPEIDTNTGTTVLEPIPPMMYAGYETTQLPPYDYVTNGGGQVFVNLLTSNGNELAVGWLERATFTNLYNTKSQTLITYSQAHDDEFPNANQPEGTIVGGYSFQISAGATNGQQYQIQLNGASGTSDGVGAPGNSVIIFTQDNTNSTAVGAGSLNAIKNVTVGSIPYLVGDVYPFRWFNAGDFGSSNLVANGSANAEQVFEAAVYGINAPPPGSDLFDAMDSSGGLGVLDNDPTSEFYGYWTNAGTLTQAQEQTLLGGSFTNINQMAFGDGQLDVADVYVTFLRSEFTNQLVWFQRLWTNGVRVATANWAPNVIPSGVQTKSGSGKIVDATSGSTPVPVSITNTPVVNFTATDFVASAGQTLSIPITASVFGSYPINMAMLSLSVLPLDGSPALTKPVSFTLNAPFNSSEYSGSATELQQSLGNGNYSVALLPKDLPIPSNAGITGSSVIGTLSVTIPSNATAMSSYAIHFDHASASPNGVVSFPKHTLTGLITLSSRNSSYYNDGIPDSWRLRYFGTVYNQLSVSNADADGTGMKNWQKYQAGLNPTDPTSVLNVGTDQAVAQSSQDSVIYWPTVKGETYVIERSTSLFPANWIPVSTNIGNGTYLEIHDSPTNLFKFYQVLVP
jgi:hypothetical protein